MNIRRVPTWSDIQESNNFSDEILKGELVTIPARSMSDITEWLRKEFNLPESMTLDEFENFIAGKNWAQDINGVLYPVEISGVFSDQVISGRSVWVLEAAWVGETIPGEYTRNVFPHQGITPPGMYSSTEFGVIETAGRRFTHLHGPGTIYLPSSSDLASFVRYRFAQFRMVSPDYISTVQFTDASLKTLTEITLTAPDIDRIATFLQAAGTSPLETLAANSDFIAGNYAGGTISIPFAPLLPSINSRVNLEVIIEIAPRR